MANITIPSKAVFTLGADTMKIEIQTNSDRITMFPELTCNIAATLSYLANCGEVLEVRIKKANEA